jgi:hypothetical protein
VKYRGLNIKRRCARTVFGPGKVTFHRVVGGALLYLTNGLLSFRRIDRFVGLRDPNALTNLQPEGENFPKYIYYSYTPLTTIGYGDIAPVHPYARGLAILNN